MSRHIEDNDGNGGPAGATFDPVTAMIARGFDPELAKRTIAAWNKGCNFPPDIPLEFISAPIGTRTVGEVAEFPDAYNEEKLYNPLHKRVEGEPTGFFFAQKCVIKYYDNCWYLTNAPPPPPPGSKPSGGPSALMSFPFVAFNEIKPSTTPAYLVKGIIPSEGQTAVWGKPKCGKSFWVFDLVMHIALGWPYRGHRVKQCTVAYMALEGGHGFKARIEAWRKTHLEGHARPVPFYLCDKLMPAGLAASVEQLVGNIKATMGDVTPGLSCLTP
jgi:hypothetical protein